MTTCKGTFTYDCDKIGAREIASKIRALGFNCYPCSDMSLTNSYLSQKEEIRTWRHSFLFSLCFAVPSMLYMMYHMYLMPHEGHNACCMIAGLSSQNFIQFLLATPVQFYGARHFYVQVWLIILALFTCHFTVPSLVSFTGIQSLEARNAQYGRAYNVGY